MTPPNELLALALLVSGIICLAVAAVLWRRSRNAPGGKPLIVWLLALSWWDITYAIFWLNLPGPVPYFWLDITLLGVYIVPGAVLAFSLEFSSRQSSLRRPIVLALLIEPVIAFIFQWTDSWHNLYFGGRRASDTASIFVGGPVYWFNVYYSYALILTAVIILAVTYYRSGGIFRRQTALVLAAIIIPWLVNFIAVAGLEIGRTIDFTPFLSTFTAVVIAYGIERYQLLTIVPIAYGLLLENMTDGVIVLDLQERVVEINPATERWLGRSRNSVYGEYAEEVFSRWPMIFKKFPLKEIYQIHDDVLLDEDNQVYLDLQISPLLDKQGQRVGRLVIGRDISQLKRAQKEISEALEFNRTIVASSPIGIVIYDSAGACVSANQAAAQIMGTSAENLSKQNYHTIDGWKTCGQYEAAMQALDTGQAVSRQICSANDFGKKLMLNATFAPVTIGGKPHLLFMFEDDSERQMAQAALQAAHAELEHRVRERTAELQTTNLALEKAVSARDEFMAAISHELRTPLSTILGLSDVLQQNVYGSLTEKQSRAIQNIEISGQRLLDLINDVLVFTQLQSGRFELQRSHCNLADICRSSLQAVAGQAANKRQQLDFHMQPDSISVNADESCLRQILANLLNNAIKFTPEQGHIELSVTALPADGKIRIRVRDNGIGILAEDFPRLFKPFVQIDAQLARRYEGTGLGLALVKAMTELHGGRVEVESVFGQGSTFTVTLPWLIQAENPPPD